MKTSKKCFQLLLVLILVGCEHLFAQDSKTKPTLTVLNIDTKGVPYDPSQMGNMVRIELEKLDMFDVTDRYDVNYLIEKNKLNISNCYGKSCLLEIGNLIKSDYIYTGSVELYGETIVMTFKLLNIKTASIEKTTVIEYLNLPLEVQNMAGLTIRKMFDKPVDAMEMERLTKKFNFETATNNPNKQNVNLQGPRFGYAFIFGENATIMKQSKDMGGYDAYPAVFQFGYQFEKQYLNEGNYQALFEIIPMVSGIDQQMFIPSLTFLNGFRNTKNGWEVAIGPSFSLASYANGGIYNGKFYTENELTNFKDANDVKIERRMSSKGTLALSSGLVFGLGKTLKSGKMNIPFNAFFTFPTKEGFRIGISVGYNSKNNN